MIVEIKDAGQFGVVKDQASYALPADAWTHAANMRFRDGSAERIVGESSVLTTPSVTPYFLSAFTTPAARYFAYAGTGKVFVDDGTTRTDITPASDFTGGVDDRWTGGNKSGILVLNNGIDQPVFWDGNPANNLVTLPGWDSNWRAAFLHPFGNYLVAGDITKSGTRNPHMVKWSHAAEPGALQDSWDETDPTLDAGEVDIASTPDMLVDCLPLGSLNVIYKERSAHYMQYIGPNDIFRFDRLYAEEIGLLARGCAAIWPGGHIVLAPGDVVVHNGQRPRSILSAKMRKWLFNMLDATNYRRAFIATNPREGEAWICFPETGASSCTLALVWNWTDDTLSVRSLNNATYAASGLVQAGVGDSWNADSDSWDSDVTAWEQAPYSPADARLLMSRTAPAITMAESTSSFSGAAINAILQREGLDFGEPERRKTIKAIVPRIDAPAGTQITVQVGATDDIETGTIWQPGVTYTVGTTRKVDSFASGRFIATRFSSSGGQPWRLRSYSVELEMRGRY